MTEVETAPAAAAAKTVSSDATNENSGDLALNVFKFIKKRQLENKETKPPIVESSVYSYSQSQRKNIDKNDDYYKKIDRSIAYNQLTSSIIEAASATILTNSNLRKSLRFPVEKILENKVKINLATAERINDAQKDTASGSNEADNDKKSKSSKNSKKIEGEVKIESNERPSEKAEDIPRANNSSTMTNKSKTKSSKKGKKTKVINLGYFF